MIIYGSRAKEIGKELQMDKCTHCGQLGSVSVHVIRRYAHVFWIPFFPLRKTGYSQCAHCKRVWEPNEMPDSYNQSYHNLAQQSKTPWWMFSGLGLVAVLITTGVVSAQQQNARNAKWIQAPQQGDVYEIKNNSRSYTLFRVGAVDGDTVYIQYSLYETNKSSGLSSLKEKEYDPEMVPVLKTDLKEMFDQDKIVDIDR